MFNFKIGDKITLKERKPHEYIRIILICNKWFIGICHRNKILFRNTNFNWIKFIKKNNENMNANEVKKELYKSKVNAKFSHYTAGNLYYNVQLEDGTYQFPIETVEKGPVINDESGLSMYDTETIILSSDLGTTSFDNEMKASDLNRWIAKAIEKNVFVKIS